MRLLVNINEIDDTKKKILRELDNILSQYNHLLNDVNDSVDFFDTETAEYFRDIVINNIKEQKDYINNSFIPLANNLDNIKQKYEELNQKLEGSVN